MHPEHNKKLFIQLLLCVLVLAAACVVTAVLPPVAVVPEKNAAVPTEAPGTIVKHDTASEALPERTDAMMNEVPLSPTAYGETRPDGAEEHLLNVPFMNQDAYPTGCESVSTVMLLQYYGIDIDVDTFIDSHLETGEYYLENDIFYAPHPADAFIGDPRTTASFGCYSPVIYRALQNCLPENYTVQDVSGTALEDLCRSYIDLGHPVLVWATMYMQPTSEGPTWNLPKSEETYTWLNNEHCLVLVGYDDAFYYFNDPLEYEAAIAYPRDLAEQRYAELGMQALIVFP